MTNSGLPVIKVTHNNALFTIIYRQRDRTTNYKRKHRRDVGVKGTGGDAELFDGISEKLPPNSDSNNQIVWTNIDPCVSPAFPRCPDESSHVLRKIKSIVVEYNTTGRLLLTYTNKLKHKY